MAMNGIKTDKLMINYGEIWHLLSLAIPDRSFVLDY